MCLFTCIKCKKSGASPRCLNEQPRAGTYPIECFDEVGRGMCKNCLDGSMRIHRAITIIRSNLAIDLKPPAAIVMDYEARDRFMVQLPDGPALIAQHDGVFDGLRLYTNQITMLNNMAVILITNPKILEEVEA